MSGRAEDVGDSSSQRKRKCQLCTLHSAWGPLSAHAASRIRCSIACSKSRIKSFFLSSVVSLWTYHAVVSYFFFFFFNLLFNVMLSGAQTHSRPYRPSLKPETVPLPLGDYFGARKQTVRSLSWRGGRG